MHHQVFEWIAGRRWSRQQELRRETSITWSMYWWSSKGGWCARYDEEFV